MRLEQRSANTFDKGPNSKYLLDFVDQMCSTTTLPLGSQGQYAKDWALLCSSKTLFLKSCSQI